MDYRTGYTSLNVIEPFRINKKMLERLIPISLARQGNISEGFYFRGPSCITFYM